MKTQVGELVLRKIRGEPRWRASFDCQRRWYFGPSPEAAVGLACRSLAYDFTERANARYDIRRPEPCPLPDLSALVTTAAGHSV
jgi:hypothetical protein